MDAGEQPKSSPAAHLAKYQFAPGVSGNPSGRPKGTGSLLAILRTKLKQAPPGWSEKTWAEVLVEKTILDAFNGDGPSRKLVWEMIEGKPSAMGERDDGEGPPIIIDDIRLPDE